VFESKASYSELGVAVILTPNGMNALRSLGRGIAAAVLGAGRPMPINSMLRILNPDGTYLNEARTYGDLEALYGSPQVTIKRSLLLDILLSAHGPDGLYASSELVGFEESGEVVEAAFATGRSTITGLLVGADGLNSCVRRTLHGPVEPRYTGWSNLRGVSSGIPMPDGLSEGIAVMAGHDHVMSTPVGRNGELYWSSAFVVEPGEWPREGGAAQHEVLRRIGGWFFVEKVVRAADPATLVAREIRDRPPLDSFSTERVTLLGDAAHPMSNFWGQGANSAIEDGVALARCLRAAGGDHARGLAQYDSERVPRTARLIKESSSIERHVGNPDEFVRWIYSYDAASGDSPVPMPA
jgi:salicylate hydroxylase